jgi:REP element-mobilizing transposase RayT
MTGEQKNAFKQEVKHRMGRRLNGWDYAGRGIYMITITIEGRRPLLGRLVKIGGEWSVELSAAGRIVQDCLAEISTQWPGVSLIAVQLMPDHLHFIIFVERQQQKPLGAIVGSIKAKSTSRYLAAQDLAASGQAQDSACTKAQDGAEYCASPRAAKFWAQGYVDLVLLRRGQLEKMIAYLRDNPRRLGVKREHPDLFKVLRDVEAKGMHFSAIGNHFLLAAPVIFQVQCSRSSFAYRRERLDTSPQAAKRRIEPQAPRRSTWRILRDAQGRPLVEKITPEFEAKATAALEAAKRGAVLISPCISHGEHEIARRVFEAGYRIITLQNKGFSPIYKPGGKLFDKCAAGNLLMLAPINWPYIPGEKPPTRESSLVLNRIAQLLAGEGAAEIDYKGATMRGIDDMVKHLCAKGLAASRQAQNQVQNSANGQAQNSASAKKQPQNANKKAQYCASPCAAKNQGEEL